MLKTQFTLIEKVALTHDVYELTYSCPDMIREMPKPGQYVMFQLAPGLNRAYSIASFYGGESTHLSLPTFTLIIKRIADGRGSPIICDAEVGTTFSGMLPLGHFTLRENTKSKCFIGTGTGFAPLYCQMAHTDEMSKVAFVFGVRNFVDDFYEEEIREIGERFAHFTHVQYFSRESEFPQVEDSKTPKLQHSGYVTDWLTETNVASYEEFYICGSPPMVKSAREILETLGVLQENIFFEQF